MIDVSRRSLFGLLAAPAIISITGRLQPALIAEPKWYLPEPVVLMPGSVAPISNRPPSWVGYHRFREIVEPILREHFEEAMKWEDFYERREVQRHLRWLPASDDRPHDRQAAARRASGAAGDPAGVGRDDDP